MRRALSADRGQLTVVMLRPDCLTTELLNQNNGASYPIDFVLGSWRVSKWHVSRRPFACLLFFSIFPSVPPFFLTPIFYSHYMIPCILSWLFNVLLRVESPAGGLVREKLFKREVVDSNGDGWDIMSEIVDNLLALSFIRSFLQSHFQISFFFSVLLLNIIHFLTASW